MTLGFFLKGFLIGFSIAAPVGPIGVLCIQRTLSRGRLTGFVSGLGAATADALYGCVAGFGLTFISSFLLSSQVWLRVIGGSFLCYLGVKTFLSAPSLKQTLGSGAGLLHSYVSTVFLTLTNPTTILSFAAILAGLGIGSAGGGYADSMVLVVGVFSGSAVWWLILSTVTSLFQSRLSMKAMRSVNKGSGVIIGGFGLIALASVIV